MIQDCLSLPREASTRARCKSGLDPLRFGVLIGDIGLQQLLILPLDQRRDISEQGPFIDWYLGDTRVYKRTTRTLLFAFCPDIGRHIVPLDGRFIIRLPQGFSNVLAVKLAVLYMEQHLLNPRIGSAPWKVGDDVATYIYLAELFAFIGMPDTSQKIERAVLRRFRGPSLQIEQIRAIWGRDNHTTPSRYAEAMADNIITFMCVPKMHLFAIEYDIDPDQTYEQVVKKAIRRMKDNHPEIEGSVECSTFRSSLTNCLGVMTDEHDTRRRSWNDYWRRLRTLR
ncbi:hypothetical protein C7974DRAFT_385748 [Boeremia exigua]|uniref:uncharacterized protein n=1 Tax=Boeremia exigua TaxID=749465 RepID=UPI001E8D63F1|nr:uncharacterized protein C7974DRAFT_385748 [Boeremia exigua]KAH6642597.1 hypothetical protein C7974DRAFT_385748 [Boeremia exigua]